MSQYNNAVLQVKEIGLWTSLQEEIYRTAQTILKLRGTNPEYRPTAISVQVSHHHWFVEGNIWVIRYSYGRLLYPPHNEVVGGVYWFHSVRPSVRPSRMPCPLCIIYSYGWILFILSTNDHYHERVCRAPWPLTLTYIFKVIWPWLRESCPLCSVYSSGWILPIFGTNDHYH